LRLRHDVVMIGRACVAPLPSEFQARLAGPLGNVSDAIVAYLRAAAAALRGGAETPAIEPVEAALEAYAAEVAAVRAEGLTRGLPADVIERFFALGFSLEQMHKNLLDLQRCVTEWCEAPAVARQSAGE
jgi:hypothetical protein